MALVTGRKSLPLEMTIFLAPAARISWGAATAANAAAEPIHSRLFIGIDALLLADYIRIRMTARLVVFGVLAGEMYRLIHA
jgi:hypothetical protein